MSWTIGGGSVSACSNANANIGTLSGAVRTYTCTITNTATGTYIATAAYQGDTNYTAKSAGPLTVAISANSATVGAITPTTSTLGGSVTLSTIVTGTSATPTGSVNWTITAPLISASISCTASTRTLVLGQVVIPLPIPAPFQQQQPVITARSLPSPATLITAQRSHLPPLSMLISNHPLLNVSGIQSSTSNGQIITFTATITGTTGSVAPTGAPTWSLTGPGGVIAASTCTSTGPLISTVTTTYTCAIPVTTAGTTAPPSPMPVITTTPTQVHRILQR